MKKLFYNVRVRFSLQVRRLYSYVFWCYAVKDIVDFYRKSTYNDTVKESYEKATETIEHIKEVEEVKNML